MQKLTSCEIFALTDLVIERLEQLNPKPRFFGRKAWERRMHKFHANFFNVLEQGNMNFYGAIWHFFECNDKLFLGECGMRELAEHTTCTDGVWVYHNPSTNLYRAVYPSNKILVPMS